MQAFLAGEGYGGWQYLSIRVAGTLQLPTEPPERRSALQQALSKLCAGHVSSDKKPNVQWIPAARVATQVASYGLIANLVVARRVELARSFRLEGRANSHQLGAVGARLQDRFVRRLPDPVEASERF